jgi:peptidase C25-like protein
MRLNQYWSISKPETCTSAVIPNQLTSPEIMALPIRDAQGATYVTGSLSNNSLFPVVNPVQSAGAGRQDAFVTVFAPVTMQIVFSTYLGGSNLTMGNGATISRSNGSLGAAPIFGASVNVIYAQTSPVINIVTGPEIPAATTVLNNLTINNSGGVTLSTQRAFFSAIEPLKSLRQSQGLSVVTVDIEDVYDEFSFGNKSPGAVKEFFSYAATSWKRKPRFVLFAGDASHDPKNYLGLGAFDLVPSQLVDTAFTANRADSSALQSESDQLWAEDSQLHRARLCEPVEGQSARR